MQHSPEISNELKSISPLLASLDKDNLLQVPEGYFNDLDLRITEYVILDNVSTDNISRRNFYDVPEGYFNTLSDSILAKVKAAYADEDKGANTGEELNMISPLLRSLAKDNLLSVPQGYFDSLADEVAGKIKSAYSESADEELRKLSPMLYALKSDNLFSVPSGYFDSLPGGIIEKVKPQQAKIITLKKNSWLKYAAAAVVTGIIAASSLQLFNKSHTTNSGAITTASASLPDYIKASFKYKTEEQLNEGIAKLSDDDIAKYLEKNGNALDNELLTKNTDVSEMPSQADYLIDENALNKYLDKIEGTKTDKKTKL